MCHLCHLRCHDVNRINTNSYKWLSFCGAGFAIAWPGRMNTRTRHDHPHHERHVHAARNQLQQYLASRVAVAPSALRAERVPAIAALLGRAAWWMPAEGRKVLADLGLAIYAFDDLVDESHVPVGDLLLRAEQLVSCARGE